MSKVKEWWFGDRSSNGLVLGGAILLFLLNGLVSWLLISQSEAHSEKLLEQQFDQALEMAKQSEVNARSKEIRDAAADFSTFAAAYVTAVIDSPQDVSVAKRRLTENVLRQLSTVTMTGNVFSNEIRNAAEEYKGALFAFTDALTDADSILEMRPFWESASDVLVSRDYLLALVDDAS
ncbi:hypothetical protein [Sulfitobacter sp. M22]|uniref:hypothetical protein n=1 Tax=Sulfitobacter sp. M22 TaxID=2675332 RepID=UPI001F2E98B9|nr:hypothetical protein [Sulfitobacter sp. M22]MCF7725739.1 hypothetical protein [Sulfitobacter sp. M22]